MNELMDFYTRGYAYCLHGVRLGKREAYPFTIIGISEEVDHRVSLELYLFNSLHRNKTIQPCFQHVENMTDLAKRLEKTLQCKITTVRVAKCKNNNVYTIKTITL